MNSKFKYPRTFHLSWSRGISNDDKILKNDSIFKNKIVVVSMKMDGENSTIYSDYSHARSIDSKNHESRNWLKNYITTFQHNIPKGYRVCGENLFAKHSIFYDNLESYFYGFSIWDDKNYCLSWDETLEYFNLLGIIPVPVLYYGKYDYNKIRDIENNLDFNKVEGYVIRVADKFHYNDFKHNVGKFVRENHIQDNAKHWQYERITKNLLKV